jgi:hypothetical protein
VGHIALRPPDAIPIRGIVDRLLLTAPQLAGPPEAILLQPLGPVQAGEHHLEAAGFLALVGLVVTLDSATLARVRFLFVQRLVSIPV